MGKLEEQLASERHANANLQASVSSQKKEHEQASERLGQVGEREQALKLQVDALLEGMAKLEAKHEASEKQHSLKHHFHKKVFASTCLFHFWLNVGKVQQLKPTGRTYRFF